MSLYSRRIGGFLRVARDTEKAEIRTARADSQETNHLQWLAGQLAVKVLQDAVLGRSGLAYNSPGLALSRCIDGLIKSLALLAPW